MSSSPSIHLKSSVFAVNSGRSFTIAVAAMMASPMEIFRSWRNRMPSRMILSVKSKTIMPWKNFSILAFSNSDIRWNPKTSNLEMQDALSGSLRKDSFTIFPLQRYMIALLSSINAQSLPGKGRSFLISFCQATGSGIRSCSPPFSKILRRCERAFLFFSKADPNSDSSMIRKSSLEAKFLIISTSAGLSDSKIIRFIDSNLNFKSALLQYLEFPGKSSPIRLIVFLDLLIAVGLLPFSVNFGKFLYSTIPSHSPTTQRNLT